MITTIFTPTYNRANTLPRLYESILRQTNKNLEWLIVDDGSSDNTQELVKNWIRENKIDISYYKQTNGGKHRAINKGLELAKGELFFIVDSDDFLPENSIESIFNYYPLLTGNIVGVAGRRQYPDSKIIGDLFPSDKFISDHVEKTYVMGLNGDLAEVLKTDVMKEFKFPDFPGENFCAESLIWNRIGKNHKLIFTNEVFYFCEYLEGGLSENSIKNRRKSPHYAMQVYSELAKNRRLPILIKIRTYINFWRFSFFSKDSFSNKLSKLDNRFLGIICLPLGWIMKLKDNKINKVKINK
ncbi:glycosyltransferase family 2 protein [Capnocytophaga stomatis]|uniref:Glycosyltransferase family 2 protein n=1 Tax=Capnocytophaga stomatis TaxID=1848904 RepID=A0ABW8QA33_9FLAO|nr:glycosyltransferase family 2 protein [Capnocytophaga stomatis]GIJ93925.1 sugar transferase [Capnocytophaga stomatis]